MSVRMTPILAIVFLDAIGMGIIIPVMPGLVSELTGATTANAALWGGLLTGAYAVMLFLCGPLIGAMSDRFGRRPVLIAALLAMVLDYALLTLAGTIGLLLVGRIVAGITGASYAVATACAADITRPGDRQQAFGMIGAAFALGLVLGPALGGLAAGFGLRAPFILAGGLSVVALLGVLLLLPETLPDIHRRPFDWRRSNPLGALATLARHSALVRPAVLILLLGIAHQVYPSIWAWFTAVQFGFSAASIGVTITVFGLCMALVQGLLVKPLVTLLGEDAALRFGLLVNLGVLAFVPVVNDAALFVALIPMMALGFVVGPVLQGQMSRAVDADRQGELMGVMSSLAAMSMMVGPFLMTGAFHVFAADHASIRMPGAPFLLAAVVIALCLALALRLGQRETVRPVS